MKRLLLPLALLALLAGGCGFRRAEARRFDEGPATAYFREQEARARAPLPPPPAREPSPPPAEAAAAPAAPAPADDLAGILPAGAGTEALRAAAATDEGTAAALAAGPLDLETVRVLAALRAPAVRAARAARRAAVERIDQAAWLEELLASFRPFTRVLDTGTRDQPWKAMTSESAPWPSTVAFRGEMARAEVAMAGEDLRAAVADAASSAEEAWFELWHAEHSLHLKTGFLETLRGTADVAARRYASGQGMQEEATRVGVEIADLDADVARHRAERTAAASRLNGLLARPSGAPLPGTGLPAFPGALPAAERVEETARGRNPMVLAKGYSLDERRAALRMAETMLHGQPATAARLERGRGLEAGPDRSMETAARAPMADAPLLYGPEEAYLRELRLQLAAAGESREAARREAGTEAREAWTRLDTALREFRVQEGTAIPLAREAYDVSARAYEAGTGRFADHIQAWWMLVEAEHTGVEARMRAGFARAALLRATGVETTERPR